MKQNDENALRAEWQAEARQQTLETLPAFLEKLAKHPHDYGSIVVAMGTAAVGACWAMNKTPQGGVTGFQAGAVMWEFVRGWHDSGEEKPRMLLDFSLMLFPQYASRFDSHLGAGVWEWLKKRAAENLALRSGVHPGVIEHWESIVRGQVPFGWKVRHDPV